MINKRFQICESMLGSKYTQANAFAIIGELMCLGYNVEYGTNQEEQSALGITAPYSIEEFNYAIKNALGE
jgi:hypothetical protein